MSECGLQDIPKDVLSFFHPTPHRHRQPGKADNRHARNYTLKLPLSLIVTMHYAAARNCRKRAFPGLPDECQDRLGAALLRPARPPLLPAAATASVVSKGLRNHSGCLCFPARKNSESEARPAQTMSAQARCLVARYTRSGLYESRCRELRLVHSRPRLGFRFPTDDAQARMNPGEYGSSA